MLENVEGAGVVPQTEDIEANYCGQVLGDLESEGEPVRENTEGVANKEQQRCNRQLCPQEEQRCIGCVQNPFVSVQAVIFGHSPITSVSTHAMTIYDTCQRR